MSLIFIQVYKGRDEKNAKHHAKLVYHIDEFKKIGQAGYKKAGYRRVRPVIAKHWNFTDYPKKFEQ